MRVTMTLNSPQIRIDPSYLRMGKMGPAYLEILMGVTTQGLGGTVTLFPLCRVGHSALAWGRKNEGEHQNGHELLPSYLVVCQSRR